MEAPQEERGLIANRDLVVHIIGDDRSYQRTLKQSTAATVAFDRQMKATTASTATLNRTLTTGAFARGGLQGIFGGLGKTGGFLAGALAVGVLKQSTTAASNLAEQTNKVRAIFKDSAREVEVFATTTARSMGIANDQALAAAGTFGNLFTTVGLAPAANARLSTSLVKLAADLASFNNVDDPSEVLDALRSGLVGEAEPLRRFGVLLTEARVQQEAMRESGKQSATQLTQQEKLLARYQLILRDTTTAQGDFARTSKGLANQQRTLNAELRESQSRLGKGVVPVVLGAIVSFNKLLDAVDAVGDAFDRLTGRGGIDPFRWLTHRIFGAGSTTAAPSTAITGEDIGQRGTFARQVTIPGLAGAPPRPRASLAFQMSMLRGRFAQAELTATQRDDRATLVLMQNLLHRQVTATKDLKLRTQLYGDLKSVQDQITAIDDQAAAARADVLDKEKAAKQKQLDAEKKRLEAHRAHIRKMRAAWQEQLQALRAAADQVRNEFGTLPFQATPAGILGVQGQSTRSFVGAYVNQTRQFVGFYNNLNRLRKMGAPRGLLEQLRGQGAETGGIIARGLITHPAQLRRLVRAFGERERVVQQIAHADIHARIVHLHMAGARPGATTTASRRGRNAGIPLTGT